MDETDTDTLIALVVSLLPQSQQTHTTEQILDALTRAHGDANIAAQYIQSNPSQSDKAPVARKRKRVDLDSWLNPARPQKQNKDFVKNKESSVSSRLTVLQPACQPSSSGSKAVNLMDILKQPPPIRKSLPQIPPLFLPNPDMVARYTPCSMHLSVLPPELACHLFYRMIDASKKWKRNKWWLFDKVVESPHLTSFFARKTDGLNDDESWQEAAQYWYNGRQTEPPEVFPPEMEQACKIVEQIVNQEIRKRTRAYKLEWGGGSGDESLWKANVAASNCYQGGKESVGFHTDQLTYLGPYPTIGSLSLGTQRNFSLREVIPTEEIGKRRAQTFNIPLPHNSLTIMHASCQEKFKHAIPPQSAVDLFKPPFPPHDGVDAVWEPSNCRINITFRFYRPDFHPSSIPRCHCGVPTILRPDMKNRVNEETDRYFWTCYAGAQNDGKGCNFWKLLDMDSEGRGPCIGALPIFQHKTGYSLFRIK